MSYETTSADVKVWTLAATMVGAVVLATALTASPREPAPPRPPDPVVVTKCAQTILPNLCMYVDGYGFPDPKPNPSLSPTS